MTTTKRTNGEGSIYFRKSDSRWCATLTVTQDTDDKPRRVTRTAKTEREARSKLTELKREYLKTGDVQTSRLNVETWARTWLDDIASKEVRPKTTASYRTTIERYIIPEMGTRQLKKLIPDDVRQLVKSVTDKGLSTRSAALTYQVFALLLEAALREGKVSRNVTKLVNRPRTKRDELVVLTAADGVKVLQATTGTPAPLSVDRLASRWWAALFTGARQGELLGLTWDRVDFNRNTIELSWQLQRLSWEHGCSKPVGEDDKGKPAYACGKKRGAECPKRKLTSPADWEHKHLTGGLYLSRPKSDAGLRVIPLVSPLLEMMQLRQRASVLEHNPHGLVWTQDNGAPIDPSRDNKAWHAVLLAAGVPDARLHSARHTTASLLRKAGVDTGTITKILGHSTEAMSEKYIDYDEESLSAAMRSISPMLALPPVRG